MMMHATQQSRRSRSDTWIESLVLAVILALAAAALLGGCLAEKKEVPASTAIPTWTEMTTSGGTLASNCGCHNTASGAGGLAMQTTDYATVVTGGQMGGSAQSSAFRIVDPGNSADSLLHMASVGDARITDVTTPSWPMPGGSSAASDIAAWINAGAPEN